MGSVGLSFGNPTSGDGFNVSATVSEILANYQAVETPWNTQISTLNAESSAFSSIGTGLSTLSTAFGVLTNFEGVLASKEGSSSDPNVLALTGASTSAVAGSHTITVTSLASTSAFSTSGTPIAATDTLAAGSLSIKVGSGAAQSISISAGDTLSTLAASINNAGIGVTASVLTDENGSYLSLVSGTSGSAGNLTIGGSLTDATTGNSAVNFSQSQAGSDAQLTVDGNTVTSSSNTVTDAIPGVTLQLLDTSTSSGPVQVEITNDTADVSSSLETFVSAYNNVITALNTQEGNDAAGNPEPLFGNSDIALLQEQLGSAINETQTGSWSSSASLISASDTLSGNLNITVGSGSVQTFAAGGNLASLASQINTANIGVTASVVTNTQGSYLNLVSKTGGTAGNLAVTSTLTDTTTSGSAVNFAETAAGSAIDGFGALGVTVNGDGTLSLNTDTLSTALNEDYQNVVAFFQDVSGVGSALSTTLSNLGSSTPTGVVTEALGAISAQESTLNTDITNENVVISQEQIQLTAELEQANQTLQSLPSQVDEVNELYAAITGYGENQN